MLDFLLVLSIAGGGFWVGYGIGSDIEAIDWTDVAVMCGIVSAISLTLERLNA